MRKFVLIVPTVVVIGFVLAGILASMDRDGSSTGERASIHLEEALAPPSWDSPFGRDEEGRDLLKRVFAGARLSLGVAAGVVGITTLMGLLIGGMAGLREGRADYLFVLVTDALLAFPGILLVIALASLQQEPGVGGLVAILSILGWVGPARLVRGQVLALKSRPFVEAAVGLGVSSRRLLWCHLVPNLMGPVVVQASFQAAGVILVESTLSFLGIGFPPDTPSWGGLMDQGIQFLLIAPHMVIFPGLALTLTVLSLNMVGDRLGDYLERI